MLPKGWSKSPLSDVADVRTGLAKGKKDIKNPIELPYLRVANVQDGYLDLNEIKMIQVDKSQIERYRLKKGDVLMNEGGDFDKLGRGDVWNEEIPICLHQNHVFSVRPNQALIIPYFLAQFAGSVVGKNYFISCSKRSTNLASINSTQLKEFPILVPPLPEQIKIAEILSTWDNAINTVQKLLANSQQQKKALMQQLLTGKKRFAGFDGEWEEKRLGDISDMNSGGTPKSSVPDFYNGDIPWVSIADMTKQGKFINSTERYITGLGMENSSARLYPKNTILYAMYASIGESSIANVECCSSQAILGIRSKKELYYEFLYFYLCFLKEEIKLQGQQGTQSNLNAAMVKDFKIKLPLFPEQQKIAAVLTTADQEIDNLRAQLNHLKQEKKALMQQLLTGKRRVKVEEAA